MNLHPCLQYGGIREERAIVGDRKGSCYVLGVTGGWRVNGRAKGVNREARDHEVEVSSRGDCVAGHTIMDGRLQLIIEFHVRPREQATWVRSNDTSCMTSRRSAESGECE